MRAERSDAGSAQSRGYPSPRAGGSAPRSRPSDRGRPAAGRRVPPPAVRNERDDDWGYDKQRPDSRRPPNPERVPERAPDRRPAAPAGAPRVDRAAAPASREVPSGPWLRGSVVVLGMFLVTLAAAAVDSYMGVGLGIITLIALLLSSATACLLVRRRDLFSVVVAPPLVFLGVVVVNIVLAPSVTFSLPTIATLLIRGFPAMGLAVGVAFLLSIGRLIARR
jgi:hypothetical protein